VTDQEVIVSKSLEGFQKKSKKRKNQRKEKIKRK
jgi:hypothetical protein